MSATWEDDEGSPDPNSHEDQGGHRLRVFVSSTLGELKSEREAAKSAIKSLRLVPAGVDLGSLPGQDGPALEDADIFVGIYWQSYGWTTDDSPVSDLEQEYDRGAGLPRLIYVKEPAAEREEGLRRLLDRIGNDGRSPSRSFESPGDLAEMLVEDLAALVAERFATAEPEPGSLPLGTLTFLFGDVAGSTALVEQLGISYSEVLTGYHDTVSEATGRHGGTVVDLEGERVFVVFQDAFEAVRAAVEIQTDLAGRDWPQSVEVRARLGLHTGTARIGSGGYVGLDVHRASRVASTAHGQQIVVSAPVRELVEGHLAEAGWQVRELGSYALKGLSRAEKLFQVEAPGLRTHFPPPRARSTTRVRLPTS
ncbi:MAG TPA: adenylate/guanylate cyclase domain-containing protein, partial [Acidimicrobiia bacterium]